MSLVKNGMSWLKPLTVDSKLLSTLWMWCQLPTQHAHQKDAPSESELGLLDRKAFVWCLDVFYLNVDSNQEQARTSCPGWGCWGLPGSFPVARAFNLCFLQNPSVGCFQHGGFLNPTSTDALDPVILFSWAFLCITGHWQHPWYLPTHQRPTMLT